MASQKLCHQFQLGNCRYGDTCRFQHDTEATSTRKPCHHFAKGSCKLGEACEYSHDPADIQQYRSSKEPSGVDAKFRQWRYNIPKDPKNVKKLGAGMMSFWQDALVLLGGDAGLIQEVITLLASEGGMQRIAELLDRPLEELNDYQLARIFETRVLPFLKTITHENVVASAVLEGRLMSIYNYVFGHGGDRAIRLFNAVVRYFRSVAPFLGGHIELVDEKSVCSLETSIAALSKVVEINTTAQINEDFHPIVEELSKCLSNFPDTFTTTRISKQLARVRQRLGLGNALAADATTKTKSGRIATFELARDMPGELCVKGPRHDNDKVDIRDISILPTLQEIQSSRTEYLPLSDPAQWHLDGLEGLLDRNFRLLREDTIGQLRDAAKFEIERLQHPFKDKDQSPTGRVARTCVYNQVVVENAVFDIYRGLEFVMGFDQPQHLMLKSRAERRDWWKCSKRLGADALICLINSKGATTFFVVAPEPPRHDAACSVPGVSRLHQGEPWLAILRCACAKLNSFRTLRGGCDTASLVRRALDFALLRISILVFRAVRDPRMHSFVSIWH